MYIMYIYIHISDKKCETFQTRMEASNWILMKAGSRKPGGVKKFITRSPGRWLSSTVAVQYPAPLLGGTMALDMELIGDIFSLQYQGTKFW